jgi:hypothetical protein
VDDLIIVTTRDAWQLLTDPGNPHLICRGREVRVVRQRAWRDFYAADGALLIMSRDDLAAIDPEALHDDPGSLASRLTIFANELAAS